MADEPENLTLKLLREMRAEQERFAAMLGKVTDAVLRIAATQEHHTDVLTRHSDVLAQHSDVLARHSEFLEHHSELLGKLYAIQQNNGARLNTIDGRLAIIEQHTGLVKA
jgi:hypothetical protein